MIHNLLQKALLYDVSTPQFVAGCRALGLIDKYVTSPLWRLIERPGHKLDMNDHYSELKDFLDRCEKDLSAFIRGIDICPSPTASQTLGR